MKQMNTTVNFDDMISLTKERINELMNCENTDEISDHRYNVIYARESTKKQAEDGFNLDMQVKKCKEWNIFKGYDNIRVYEEKGASAKNTNRKQLNVLKEDIKKGKVKTVTVYKLDRLVRRLKGLSELLELFEEYDVKLISLCEDINTSTAMGRMLMNLVVMIAEWEEDTISERTKDGLIEGAEQGFYMKGNKPPFGYDRIAVGKHYMLKVNKEEKRLIRKMRDLLKSGYSMYMIKTLIDDDEYMKANRKTLCENQINNILKNKIMMGIMIMNKKEYKLKMDETVFTKDEFKEVQQLLSERGHESKYNYLFGNKVRSAQGTLSSKKSTVKKNGVFLYYYDNLLKQRINEKAVTNAVIEHLAEKQVLYKAERKKTYENDLKAIEKKKKDLDRAYHMALITTDIYKRRLIALNQEKQYMKELKTKYIDCLMSYFNTLKHKEKEYIIWKHVKYIEVDYQAKEVINIC